MREHFRVKQHRNPLYCIALVAQLLTRTYCTNTAEYAGLQCEAGRLIPWSKLQHGTTCCNAYIEAATTGLSWAMETPSQIVVTAAAAVAHTASMKSKQSRAPPAVGISCCPVRAGTTACVVDSALLASPPVRFACGWAPAVSFPGRHSSRGSHVARYPTQHGIQWRMLPACADGGRFAALSSPTVVSGSDDNETAAHSSASAVEGSHGVTWSER